MEINCEKVTVCTSWYECEWSSHNNVDGIRERRKRYRNIRPGRGEERRWRQGVPLYPSIGDLLYCISGSGQFPYKIPLEKRRVGARLAELKVWKLRMKWKIPLGNYRSKRILMVRRKESWAGIYERIGRWVGKKIYTLRIIDRSFARNRSLKKGREKFDPGYITQ